MSLDAPVDVFVWLFLFLYGLPWQGWLGGTLLPVEWLSEVLSFVSSAMVEVKNGGAGGTGSTWSCVCTFSIRLKTD